MIQPRLPVALIALVLAAPATAQLTSVPHTSEQSILVTGERSKHGGPRPALSDWNVAETNHVLLFSKSSAADVSRIASNLEKLHFLLSVLLNRGDSDDETLKLSVTMIGDRADFDHLGLHNVRWQQGPYPSEFPNQVYYDPREDGVVMATPNADQCFKIVRDAAVYTQNDFQGVMTAAMGTPGGPSSGDGAPSTSVGGVAGAGVPSDVGAAVAAAGGNGGTHCDGNPNMVGVSAEGRLYATFAQHFLLTYFPAAYPRWYLEGFGEIFSNIDTSQPGVIEYGRWPDQYRKVVDKFGRYPVDRVLNETYLNDKRWFPAFSPYSAWGLAHLLFFAPEWKKPLHNYLAAIAKGESPEQAATAFGDGKVLQKQLSSYYGRKVPFERLTYPVGRFQAPIVRRLKESEANYVRGRLELGARVTIADAGDTRKAIGARGSWLDRLRKAAAEFPGELVNHQLLAEAECRSGNADSCVASADRALALAPDDPVALTWKGYGLALQALTVPAGQRESALKLARSTIIRANRVDTESVLPLLAYYRSYALAGEQAPDAAVDGLAKSVDEVPAAPTTRVLLGSALVERADHRDARRILLPVAAGPFDSPEKSEAKRLLSAASGKAVADNAVQRK
jgi:hypothetical protein